MMGLMEGAKRFASYPFLIASIKYLVVNVIFVSVGNGFILIIDDAH
jgi:hypothetical protein